MLAPVLVEYGKIAFKEFPLPVIGDDEVLVKISYASICGSDQHVFRGDFHPRTRLPFVQGHEFAGTVHNIGKNIKKVKPGDRVAVDPIFWCGKCAACEKGHHQACESLRLLGIDVNGGFGQYVAAKDFMLYPLPDSLTDRQGAMVEVFSIGFHACNRSGLQQGDIAAIWGAGKIGQVILQAARCRTQGALFIVDIIPERLNIARKACPSAIVINALIEDPVERIRRETAGRGVDVAFEAIGHFREMENRRNPVRSCVQAIRQGGLVCVLGLDDRPVPIVMKELILKEAKIVASRVSAGEFAETIEKMVKKEINPDTLISCELPASKTQQAFEMLEKEPEKYLKILIRPGC